MWSCLAVQLKDAARIIYEYLLTPLFCSTQITTTTTTTTKLLLQRRSMWRQRSITSHNASVTARRGLWEGLLRHQFIRVWRVPPNHHRSRSQEKTPRPLLVTQATSWQAVSASIRLADIIGGSCHKYPFPLCRDKSMLVIFCRDKTRAPVFARVPQYAL